MKQPSRDLSIGSNFSKSLLSSLYDARQLSIPRSREGEVRQKVRWAFLEETRRDGDSAPTNTRRSDVHPASTQTND